MVSDPRFSSKGGGAPQSGQRTGGYLPPRQDKGLTASADRRLSDATVRAVRLLRSRRRTFLFDFGFVLLNCLQNIIQESSKYTNKNLLLSYDINSMQSFVHNFSSIGTD